jgi:hypothetical protein
VFNMSKLNPNSDVQFMMNKKYVNLQQVKVHNHSHAIN